jgi:hypothetical protein
MRTPQNRQFNHINFHTTNSPSGKDKPFYPTYNNVLLKLYLASLQTPRKEYPYLERFDGAFAATTRRGWLTGCAWRHLCLRPRIPASKRFKFLRFTPPQFPSGVVPPPNRMNRHCLRATYHEGATASPSLPWTIHSQCRRQRRPSSGRTIDWRRKLLVS